ncbi:hypothetical protein BH10PSE14_BH10PSE14_06820 [soil metagenome]
MTLPVYPGAQLLRGLTYNSKWSPTFFNASVTTSTGADIDVGLALHPLHDFELVYSFLRDGPSWRDALSGMEFRTMMGFHLALSGTLGRFLYRNPDDCEVFQNAIGAGDGTTTMFTITRTFGANGYFGTEPVGQVATDAGVNVYLGGSSTPLDPTLYAIDTSQPVANTITFDTAPGADQAISIDMQYFYYCKLAQNGNTFEKFMDRLWMLGKVSLHSCRAGA